MSVFALDTTLQCAIWSKNLREMQIVRLIEIGEEDGGDLGSDGRPKDAVDRQKVYCLYFLPLSTKTACFVKLLLSARCAKSPLQKQQGRYPLITYTSSCYKSRHDD